MYGVLMMVAAVSGMVKVANIEGRSGLLWGLYTFVLFLIIEGLLGGLVGVLFAGLGAFVLSYLTMFILKVVGED